MVFFIMNARIYRSNFQITPPMFWHTIIPALPVYFLSVACILNLNHWIAYYFKIGEIAIMVNPYLRDQIKMSTEKSIRCANNLFSLIGIAMVCTYITILSINSLLHDKK